jgi:hypothetical protein
METNALKEKLHDGHWVVIERLKRGESYVHVNDTASQARIYTHCYSALKHYGLIEEAKLTRDGLILFHDREYGKKMAKWATAVACLFSILSAIPSASATDWQKAPNANLWMTTECYCGTYELLAKAAKKKSDYYVGSLACDDASRFSSVRGVPAAAIRYVASGSCNHFFVAVGPKGAKFSRLVVRELAQ